MDNGLLSKSSMDNLLPKTVTDIKGCILEMKQEFEESGLCPLTDDSPALNKFCGKLEVLLQTGMRDRSSLFGGPKGYWNYMQECLSNNKNLKDGIRFVKSRSELKTNAGRGRSLIRFSLVHHRLADTFQSCLMNGRLNADWFSAKSIFHERKLINDLLMALYDLNDIQFDLDPRDAELDTCWPTFSRKPVGMVYNWRPPSRTGSIASLSSIPNLEVFPSLSSSVTRNMDETYIGEDDLFEGKELQNDFNEMTQDISVSEGELENARCRLAEAEARYEGATRRIAELEKTLLEKEFIVQEKESAFQKESLNHLTTSEMPTHAKESSEERTSVANNVENGTSVGNNLQLSASEDGKLSSSGDDTSHDAYLSTISSLQQQLMEAVGARETISEQLEVEKAKVEQLLKFEAEAGRTHKENEELLKDSAKLHEELKLAKELVKDTEKLREELKVAKELLKDSEKLHEELKVAKELVKDTEKLREELKVAKELLKDSEKLHEELKVEKDERSRAELRIKEDNFFERMFGEVMDEKTLVESSLEQQKLENSHLLEKLEKSKGENLESKNLLESAYSEKLRLSFSVEELESDVGKLRDLSSKLELQLGTSRKRIEELEANNLTNQNKVEELERNFQRISLEKDDLQKLFDEKEKLFGALEQKNSELTEEIEGNAVKSKEGEQEGLELKTKIAELEEKLTSEMVSQEERISKTKVLEESTVRLKAELTEAKESQAKLESELSSRLQKLSEELALKVAEHQQVESQLKVMEGKLEKMEKSTETLSAEKDRMIQDLQEDLDSLSGSVQRREKMWESARISMDKDIIEKSALIKMLEQVVADGFTKERLVVLEKKVAELEETLGAVKLEHEIQTNRDRVQLDDLKQCLGTLEHEKFLLAEQLNQYKKKEEDLQTEQTSFAEKQRSWEEEANRMKSDITQLKKRIIKLVKEKAELWQKTDDLAYDQKLRASYQWMNSADVSNCLICRVQFSVTVRKHHCRKCGRVLCHSCCNNWASMPHSGMKERICNECFMNDSFFEATVNSTREENSDAESGSEEQASSFSGETVSTTPESMVESSTAGQQVHELPLDEACNGTEPAQMDGDELSTEPVQSSELLDDSLHPQQIEVMCESVKELHKSSDADVAVESEEMSRASDGCGTTDAMSEAVNSSAWSLSSSARAAVSWMSTAASATTSFASGLIPRSGRPLKDGETAQDEVSASAASIQNEIDHEQTYLSAGVRHPSDLPLDQSKTNSFADDVFDVISPEEVSESRLYSVANPNVTCCSVVRIGDFESDDLTTLSEDELSIKAGKCFAIPVLIEAVGTTLVWQFSTQPKGIAFSVVYRESDGVPQDDGVTLIPLTRVDSHHQTVTGELKARKTGVYVLLFDNQSSRLTAKKLKYSLQAQLTDFTASEEVVYQD